MKMKHFLIREKQVGVGKVIFLRINKDLKFKFKKVLSISKPP